MMNANYCNLEEQTLTLLLRSVRANCGLKVLKLVGNNLTGKGTFILSEWKEEGEGGRERERERGGEREWIYILCFLAFIFVCSGCYEVQ